MRTHALAALCLVLAPSLAAQQPAQPPRQPELSEKVEVRLIEIDAVVTDRKGNHVSGLKPEDFEVLENGRPQPITNFTEVHDGVDITAKTTGAQVEGAAAAERQPRSIVILVDALPLRGRARRNLFADINALVEKTMGEGDRGQVLTWDDRVGVRVLTEMTRTRADILAALAKTEATLQAPPPDLLAQAEADWFREMAATREPDGMRFDGETHVSETARQAAQQGLALMRRKTAAFQRVVSGIAEPTHRNVLIYVSGSFPMNAGTEAISGLQAKVGTSERTEYDTGKMLEAIARTANSSGVILYALRPDLPARISRTSRTTNPANFEMSGDGGVDPYLTDMAHEQTLLQNDAQALALLTKATGGTVAIGSSAIKDAVDRIAADLGSYYTLAYRAPADGSDRERRIEIRSRTRGHIVRTRKTILDRSDETRARDLLVARLFEAGGEGALDFEIQASAAQNGVIPVELKIPVEQLRFEPEGEELAANFTVLLVAGRDIGRITRLIDDAKRVAVPKDKTPAGVVRYQFALKTGAEQATSVSVAVYDEKSGLSGIQSIDIAEGEARIEAAVASGAIADDAWRKALLRAHDERRPVLVYFRPDRCRACARFENETLAHPAIQRRLSEVVFVTLSSTDGQLAKVWKSREAGFGVFDRKGAFRLSFDGIPELPTLGIILDDITDVAPHLERAIVAAENGEPHEGELDSAIALMILGRRDDARGSLARAIEHGKPETRQYAQVARALLDGQDGRTAEAFRDLDAIIANARTPEIAGEAWLAIGLLHRMKRANDDAARAFAKARDLLGFDSRIAATSDDALAALETAADGSGPVRIIPPGEQVVSGRVSVATLVSSAEIASVAFTLDGKEIERVTRPPFAATIDFGRVPEERTISVVAFDGLGNEAGRDELTVNGGGERFWFRILEPGEGVAGGPTAVKMKLHAPAEQAVQRVTLSWNDEVRTVVSGPPWETSVRIPAGEIGILRGVAHLADGRSAEDAVLLNASGHSERADVQLVELPVTVSDPEAKLDRSGVVVREGGQRRAPESVQPPAESPLTIGFVIDTSGSMSDHLVTVQEAAIGFLESALGERDRGFIVGFSTRARLVQAPTTDKARLRAKMMSLRARGSTALYDAIAVGLLQLQGVKGRRALVVFTDGADLTSRYGATDIAALAKRTHVPIHLIATAPNRATQKVGGPRPDELRWGAMYRTLTAMAESTGGRAYVLDKFEELPQVYQRIGDALRSQFLVFVRTEPGRNENDWRSIEVVARGVTLFAPEGYYAPW